MKPLEVSRHKILGGLGSPGAAGGSLSSSRACNLALEPLSSSTRCVPPRAVSPCAAMVDLLDLPVGSPSRRLFAEDTLFLNFCQPLLETPSIPRMSGTDCPLHFDEACGRSPSPVLLREENCGFAGALGSGGGQGPGGKLSTASKVAARRIRRPEGGGAFGGRALAAVGRRGDGPLQDHRQRDAQTYETPGRWFTEPVGV